MENRLSLTTITALLSVISSLSLSSQRCLTSLVLGDLVRGVLLAGFTLAIGSSGPMRKEGEEMIGQR